MPEKRHLKRMHLIYYLNVFDRETKKILGQLVDISRNGLMLISQNPIDVNKLYHLRMEFPEPIRESKFIEFDAECIRSEKDINPDFYNTGLTFVEIDPSDISRINLLIKKFGFKD